MLKIKAKQTSCILVIVLFINLLLFLVNDDLSLILIFGLLLLYELFLMIIGLVFCWRWLVSIRVAFIIILIFSWGRNVKMPIYRMFISLNSINGWLLTIPIPFLIHSTLLISFVQRLNRIIMITPILRNLTKLYLQQCLFILKLHNNQLKAIFIINCLFWLFLGSLILSFCIH